MDFFINANVFLNLLNKKIVKRGKAEHSLMTMIL